MAILRLALAFAAFISVGLPDALLGVSWPFARDSFGQSLDAAGILVFGATVGYSLSALAAGRLIPMLGLGGLLTLSTCLTSLGLGIYLLEPNFWVLVTVVTLAAVGGGSIDVGLNHYAMDYHGSAVMQWLHASFGVGVTIGPALMVLAIAGPGGWQSGYAWVAAGLAALALVFALSYRIWPTLADHAQASGAIGPMQALRSPRVLGAVSMFAIYVGLETAIGIWAFSVMLDRQVSAVQAGVWVSAYWGSFTISRILAGMMGDRVSHWMWLRLSLVGAALASAIWMIGSGWMATLPVALIGFAMGPIYPAMMSGTSDRVSAELKAAAIPLQVGPPILVAGLIVWAFGVVGEGFGLQWIPWLVFSFLVILLLIESQLLAAARKSLD